jgi:hypothetical protein
MNIRVKRKNDALERQFIIHEIAVDIGRYYVREF